MFSKACEYGIKASIFIANQSKLGREVSLKEVAEAIESPAAYTSKILQQLSRSNIINSEKGSTGGFSMNKNEMDNVKLYTIFSAIDGKVICFKCGLVLEKCYENKPCLVHHQYKIIRDELKNMLETTTVISLVVDYENNLTFLKR